MITRIVKLTLHPSRLEEFMNNFELVKQKIRNCNGCNHLELLVDIDNANIIFTYSMWDSPMHLANYVESDLFKSIWKEVKPMLTDKTQAWSTKVVSVTSKVS